MHRGAMAVAVTAFVFAVVVVFRALLGVVPAAGAREFAARQDALQKVSARRFLVAFAKQHARVVATVVALGIVPFARLRTTRHRARVVTFG